MCHCFRLFNLDITTVMFTYLLLARFPGCVIATVWFKNEVCQLTPEIVFTVSRHTYLLQWRVVVLQLLENNICRHNWLLHPLWHWYKVFLMAITGYETKCLIKIIILSFTLHPLQNSWKTILSCMVLQTACLLFVKWLRYNSLKNRIFEVIFPKLIISDIPGYCSKRFTWGLAH